MNLACPVAVLPISFPDRNPTIHPGPLVLWNWNEKAAKKAKATKILSEVIPARIIPMADYRPKYPKINAEVEINPNHPNLTIWHNKEDVCVFVGVHCHMANLSLKIIRGGTSCFTIALCAQAGHEDANLSLRDVTAEKILRLAEWVSKLKGTKFDRPAEEAGEGSDRHSDNIFVKSSDGGG